MVALVGLLSLLIGPLLRPQLLSNFPDSDGRIVIENLYNAFLDTFNSQTWTVVFFGVAAIAIGGALVLWQRGDIC